MSNLEEKPLKDYSLIVILKYSFFLFLIVQTLLSFSQEFKRLINSFFDVTVDTHLTIAHLLAYLTFLVLPFLCFTKLLWSHKEINIVWKLSYLAFAIYICFNGIIKF